MKSIPIRIRKETRELLMKFRMQESDKKSGSESDKKNKFQIKSGAKTTATIALRGDQGTFGSVDGVVQ
jgi:hypothetical protein